MASVSYNRKLSGTTLLVVRIALHVIVLIIGLIDIVRDSNYLIPYNIAFLFSFLLDSLFCAAFLSMPRLTCTGNGYINCLPFILNSYFGNMLVYYIKLPSLLNLEFPDQRIPHIAFYNIFSLIMYGGLACPLNLAWMEVIKPFSKVILINRKFSHAQK